MKKIKFDAVEGLNEAFEALYDLGNFAGDGSTNDSPNFAVLESTVTGKIIDLRGKSFRVDTVPTGNLYVNGQWVGPFENWEDTGDLTQPHWGKSAVTISGTNLVVPTTAVSAHHLSAPLIPVLNSFPLFVSVKAKASGYHRLRIRLGNAATGAAINDALFDLNTGSIISGSGETISAPDGNGFRTAIAKFAIPAGVIAARVQFWIYDAADGSSYAGDGVKGIEITDLKFGSLPISALQNSAVLSSNKDTGGIGSPYAGGIYGNVAFSGRTTAELFTIIASQGCRARGPSRAGILASIYSTAMGNVSGIVASRHSHAWVPQSVILGSEECAMYGGFRGVIVASIASRTENESDFVAACRNSFSAGRNSSVISASGGYVGRGGGWRGEVVVSNGQVTSITTAKNLYGNLETGRGYQIGDPIVVTDRMSGAADCVASVATIDSNGGILTVAISNGGTNYGTVVAPDGLTYIQPHVDNGKGDFSANIATSGYTEVEGLGSALIASAGSSSAWVKIKGTNTFGAAVQVGTEIDGTTSAGIAATGSKTGSASTLSVVLAANICEANGIASLATGRRTKNDTNYEWAGGDAVSGLAETANRKWSLNHQTGKFKTVIAVEVGTFADFGEYFENGFGQEIPVGTPVMLKKGKVYPWDGSKKIIGVVSATAAYIANSDSFGWNGRFLYDEFGRPIMEEAIDEDTQETVLVQKANPAYDLETVYIPKKDRPSEHTLVGIKGQVFVRVDAEFSEEDTIGDVLEVMEVTVPFDPEKGYGIVKCFI